MDAKQSGYCYKKFGNKAFPMDKAFLMHYDDDMSKEMRCNKRLLSVMLFKAIIIADYSSAEHCRRTLAQAAQTAQATQTEFLNVLKALGTPEAPIKNGKE